jgi:Fe-S cluster assembly protein SufD
VVALSERKGEPGWVREQRLAAWEVYEQLPWPTGKEEEWRRTDLRALKIDAIIPFADRSTQGNGTASVPYEDGEAVGGTVVSRNSDAAWAELAAEVAEQGVILTDLDTAVRDYPGLMQEHFQHLVPPETGKFEALHAAFWSSGTLLYVPRHRAVELPLRACYHLDQPGLGVFPHTLIVAEPGSEVTFVDYYASDLALPSPVGHGGVGTTSRPHDLTTHHSPLTTHSERGEGRGGGQSLSSGVVEIHVGDGAQVRYLSVQDWGTDLFEFTTRRAVLGRDSHITWVVSALGSRLSKANLRTTLGGTGASTKMYGLYFTQRGQHFDHYTEQDHVADHTTSDLLFKGALRGRSRTVFRGLIRVEPGAQQTDAYQANRNLLLSDKAKADSMPILEIQADDVRCTHGATVGQLDEEQLFYLKSRGLPRVAAEQIIVEGFFAEVLDKVPLEGLRGTLQRAIAAKMGM